MWVWDGVQYPDDLKKISRSEIVKGKENLRCAISQLCTSVSCEDVERCDNCVLYMRRYIIGKALLPVDVRRLTNLLNILDE